MIKDRRLSSTLRILIGLAAFGVAAWTLQPFVSLFNAVFLAFIIVLCVSPLLRWLRGKGVPNWAGFLLTLAALIFAIVALVLFLLFSLSQLANAIPGYVEQLDAVKAQIVQWLESVGIDQADVQALADLIDPRQLLDLVIGLLSTMIDALSNVILVIALVAFLLVESFSLPQKLQKVLRFGEDRWARARKYGEHVKRYVVITTYVGLVTGLGDFVLLLALGVDFAALWGVVAFLLSFVPIVGFWLALIPPFLLALLEFGLGKALLVLLGFVVINGAAENIVKPKLMGEGLDLSIGTVFLSLLFWTTILGPLGAILALPMTVGVKELVLAADPQNRWVAALLSSASSRAGDSEGSADSERANQRMSE